MEEVNPDSGHFPVVSPSPWGEVLKLLNLPWRCDSEGLGGRVKSLIFLKLHFFGYLHVGGGVI